MSTESDPLRDYSTEYGRDISEIESRIDAEGLVRSYADQVSVTDGISINSDSPYYGVLGRSTDADAEILSIIHYFQPVDLMENDSKHRASGNLSTTGNLADALEFHVPEETVMYVEGVETPLGEKLSSPRGKEIYPESIHGIVFYDQPDMTPLDLKHRLDFDNQLHEKVAMDAVEGKSLGTAIMVSGREKSALQINYWPKDVESQISDFKDLNWDNPAEL